MICPNCIKEIPDDSVKCPECQTLLQFGRLAALDSEKNFTTERALSRKLVEEQENMINRKMEEAIHLLDNTILGQLNYINPSDLGGISVIGSFDLMKGDLDLMLEADIEKLSFEGFQLQDLLSNQNKVQNALKVGLKFLKSKKYSEASEWWSLQRGQAESLQNLKIDLLFLLMEMFTHRLAGKTDLADLTSAKIRRHPEFILNK